MNTMLPSRFLADLVRGYASALYTILQSHPLVKDASTENSFNDFFSNPKKYTEIQQAVSDTIIYTVCENTVDVAEFVSLEQLFQMLPRHLEDIVDGHVMRLTNQGRLYRTLRAFLIRDNKHILFTFQDIHTTLPSFVLKDVRRFKKESHTTFVLEPVHFEIRDIILRILSIHTKLSSQEILFSLKDKRKTIRIRTIAILLVTIVFPDMPFMIIGPLLGFSDGTHIIRYVERHEAYLQCGGLKYDPLYKAILTNAYWKTLPFVNAVLDEHKRKISLSVETQKAPLMRLNKGKHFKPEEKHYKKAKEILDILTQNKESIRRKIFSNSRDKKIILLKMAFTNLFFSQYQDASGAFINSQLGRKDGYPGGVRYYISLHPKYMNEENMYKYAIKYRNIFSSILPKVTVNKNHVKESLAI